MPSFSEVKKAIDILKKYQDTPSDGRVWGGYKELGFSGVSPEKMLAEDREALESEDGLNMGWSESDEYWYMF